MSLAVSTTTKSTASVEPNLVNHFVAFAPSDQQRSVLSGLEHKTKSGNTASASYLQQVLNENQQLRAELSQHQTQNQYLLQLIDVMPTGVVILDGNGVVVKVNSIARALLDEPILGQIWRDVIHRSFKPREDDWHEVSLKNGRRVKLEIKAIDHQPGQLITITDLTETRLLQDKLSHLQRLSSLGRMVSSLAHQIRTPLSSAMLYAANLNNKKLAVSEKINFQTKLMSRLKDLEQQVNDMLLFAKSGEQPIVEPMSMRTVVIESIKQMDELIQQKSAQVVLPEGQQDCFILGNKTALAGAIQNLLNNSLQMVKQPAVVQVALHFQDAYVYLSVKDNGDGIAEELADKIFEPFVTSRVQGTGLGLAVVKSVAQAHKGDVQLLSKVGEGAHFCIKLPIFKCTEDIAQQIDSVSANASLYQQEYAHE